MQRDKKLKTINKSIYKSLLKRWGDNEEALDFLCYLIEGKTSIFLTGKAGTGKSSLIKDVIDCANSHEKHPIVLGSTGISAVNIEGKTVHSYFQLSTSNLFYPDIIEHINKFKLIEDVIKELEDAPFIIIDEISMLSANVIDCVNALLVGNIGHSDKLAFGGKQIIFTGDVLQLAPVETKERQKFFEGKYKNAWFFNSHTFKNITGYKFDYNIVKLEKNYRQDGDDGFLEILDNIRNCDISSNDINALNYCIDDGGEIDDKYIIISALNSDVDYFNRIKFDALPGKEYRFYADPWGKVPHTRAKDVIELKIGARIMMLNNDPDGRRINGSMGYVRDIDDISKVIDVELDDGEIYPVGIFEWKNKIYDRELEEIQIGGYKQLPVQLAYAITVHKSQGLTFEHAYLDIEKTFVGGQAYTALSRIKSLNGLLLSTEINKGILYFNEDALNYYLNVICEKKFDGTELTDQDAKDYSNYSGYTINLENITTISEEQAETISKFNGQVIKLSGLSEIDNNCIVALCQFNGNVINLSGLESISHLAVDILKNKEIRIITDLEYKTLGATSNKLTIVLSKNLVWSKDKTHIITGNKRDQDGYYEDLWNDDGKHKLTGTKYDPDGYNENDWDRYYFGRDGLHRDTGTEWNPKGFNKNFIHKNGTKYDDKGYDLFGYNKFGFDVTGIHRDTGTIRDKHRFNVKGINKFTDTEYDNRGFTQYGYHKFENERDELNSIDILETNTQIDSKENEPINGIVCNVDCIINKDVENKYENGSLQYRGGEKIIKDNMGNVVNLFKEGKGELYYRNGKLQYEGDFKDDLYDGEGKLYYEDGNIQFKGTFRGGKYVKGIEYFRFKNGKIRYEGGFQNGLYDGIGKLYFMDGSTYEGNFKKGKFDGNGKFMYFDGEVYEGEFKDGSYDENLKRLI